MSMAMRMAYFLTGGMCGAMLGFFVSVILLGWAMYVDKDREQKKRDNDDR